MGLKVGTSPKPSPSPKERPQSERCTCTTCPTCPTCGMPGGGVQVIRGKIPPGVQPPSTSMATGALGGVIDPADTYTEGDSNA